jgi:Cu(I)/Ag(I) efflux system membrane fusion protein/cobalt-zinc-cadmium efflux system membrane fusion protein
MKKPLFFAGLVMALALGFFFQIPKLGEVKAQRPADSTGGADATEAAAAFQCPMDPMVVSHEAGRCPICKMFLKEKQVKGGGADPVGVHVDHNHDGEVFTCPMHAIIVQDEKGRCPLCKMFLKPRPVKSKPMAKADKKPPASPTTPQTPPPKPSAKPLNPKTLPPTALAANPSPATAGSHVGHDHAQGQGDHYTCPMHPQVVQETPGSCPICGMDLVKKSMKKVEPKQLRAIKHWTAPMDPTFISDKPGKSPMGMDLVPVYDEEKGSGSVITIDPVVVQNMGVRIAQVEQGPIFRHIRTVGTIEIAEDQLSVVNLRFSGWVEKLLVDETGTKVARGQTLFELYSPELVSAQEEFILAVKSGGVDSPLAQSARRRLEFFGLSAEETEKIATSQIALRTIAVRAPQSGYVLHKNVVQGARVMAGKDLYRIGNLQKIWVNAEVYEFDAPWVKLGAKAHMELTFQRGKIYDGKVSYVYPTLNPKSRTLRVRLEFDNPGLALKPGMFATVQIEAERKDNVLRIPAEAVLHSGQRQLVFVAVEFGKYQAREIVTGLSGDRYLIEVLEGLQAGERVVTSGQFLLDSESQLQEAVQKLLAKRLHAKSSDAHAAGQSQKSGKASAADNNDDTYWTCSMHPQVVQSGPGTCPICGMDLVEKKK